MSRKRSHSRSPPFHTTNSNDPRDLERRLFVGNLPTALMDRKDFEDLFSSYGKINALSMFRGYGFVQFERPEEAEAAKAGQNGHIYRGYKLDINMAAERRQNKAQARQSPPRRPSYSGYNDDRDPRPRSRSPMHGRDSRDMRDHRDVREPVRDSGRDHRSSHPRDHDPRDSHYERYRGSQSREKDLRNPSYRDDYERYYRGDDYYRKREEPYPERYKEPWNGRRESEEERPRPEERRRNELYRQYYEELQRRYDTERPVDCSVIVVNKQQKEYAETVGRKVRDLGMVVDLIFLNTEVSLTQALEDVGRARTPFAIIITQQHQVHRSCTVNILFGTPQEHRNMPMQDAMVLVAQNYDHFKAEHRDKERDELARKAAKMADEVLMREHEREGHPVSVLTSITLLAEGRYLTREELDGLINYLQDKRDGNVRSSGDQLSGSRPIAAVSALEAQSAPSSAQSIPSTPLNSQVSQLSHTSQALHPTTHTSHLIPGLTATLPSNPLPAGTSHQQDLQAKILSLFNSGASSTPSPVATPTQTYSSTVGAQTTMPQTVVPKLAQPGAPRPALRPQVVAPEYGALGRVVTQQATQRPLTTGTGFNFDNPSVQKALDTLIQSGSSINHLVNSASQSAPRQTQGVAQSTSLSLYPRHY